MNQRWLWVVGITLLIAAFGALYYLDGIKSASPASNGLGMEDYQGKSSPAFTVEKIGGGTISLSDFKGKVVLVDFWATWCPPCVESISHLNELQAKYGSQGVQVIGLTVDRDLNPVPEFLKSHNVVYPVGIATPAEVEAFGGVSGIPTLVVVDQNQKVVAKLVGYRELPELKAVILPLLK